MSNEAATLLLGVLASYGAAGLLVGVAFLVWGIELWPLVLRRWRRVV
jgi:hypothetical protein